MAREAAGGVRAIHYAAAKAQGFAVLQLSVVATLQQWLHHFLGSYLCQFCRSLCHVAARS
jgi:hypothetical protein